MRIADLQKCVGVIDMGSNSFHLVSCSFPCNHPPPDSPLTVFGFASHHPLEGCLPHFRGGGWNSCAAPDTDDSESLQAVVRSNADGQLEFIDKVRALIIRVHSGLQGGV